MASNGAAWLNPRFPADGSPYRHRWWALLAVSLGVFLIALDITIVGVTAPLLSMGLGATATQIQWAFDAYTVVLAGFVVLGGGLAERYGRKALMQIGTVVFAAGAAVSAFAPSAGILILGRVISGFGASFVFPTCLSIISALFPPTERHRAIGIFAAISAAGLAAGPPVGGVLIGWFWWGAAFLVVVPVSLVSILAVAATVPPSRAPQTGRLDLAGAFLSVFGLGGIVFGIIEGPDRGWTNPAVLGPFVIGLVCTVAFIVWELRCPAPLFDLHVFQNAQVAGGALAMATVYFTFNSTQLLVPQYLGYVLNLPSVQTGFLMSPLGIALLLLSPASTPLVNRYGHRTMLLSSLASMTAGMLVLALLPFWGGTANVLTGLCLYGVGFSLIVAPATSAIMVAVPKEKAGDGSAVNMVSRQIGGAVGVAITGSLAAAIYRQGLSLGAFPLSEAQRQDIQRSLSGVTAAGDTLNPVIAKQLDAMADAAMAAGVATALACCAALTALVAVAAFLALREPKPAE